MKYWFRNPDIVIPLAAAVVGGLALFIGWWQGGESGFGVASGVVSVLGLMVSAFVARSIWTIRDTSRLMLSRHRSLRRVESLVAAIEQAIENKEQLELRRHLGTLGAILSTLPLPDVTAADIESLQVLLSQVPQTDDRSILKLAKQLCSPLHSVLTSIEIVLERQEVES